MTTLRIRSTALAIVTALALPIVTQADVTDEEYAVYQALLQQVKWERPNLEGYVVDKYVLRETTSAEGMRWQGAPVVLHDYEKRSLPALEPSAANAFEERNRTESRLLASRFSGVKVRLMSDREYDALWPYAPDGLVQFDGTRFRTRTDGWEYFDGKYRKSQGLLTVSRVGFSADGRQALLYYGNAWGWLAGRGCLVLMEKTSEGWKIRGGVELWVS